MQRFARNMGIFLLGATLFTGILAAQKNRGSANRSIDANTVPSGEDRLAREVRHELVMLPYYGVFDNLAYRMDGPNVTLLGQVTRPALKDEAGRAAMRIEGVGR